jgi:hypothetical protein
MFNEKSFPRSKKYFQMQQLCRIFTNSIEETIRDLQKHYKRFMSNWQSYWNHRGQQPGLEVAFLNLTIEWEKLLATQESKLTVLLDRIRKKKEEVESLRDGVSTFL